MALKPFTAAQSFFPGRMARNTAPGFIFVGLASGLLTKKTSSETLAGLGAIFGLLVFSLGFIALVAYSISAEAIYGWGGRTRMAIHTSSGLLVLGAGLTCLTWSRRTSAINPLPTWLPAAAAVGVLTLAVSLWQVFRIHEMQLHLGHDILDTLPHVADGFLGIGVMLAMMSSLATHLAQVEAGRRGELKSTNRNLQLAINERREVEATLRQRETELKRFLNNAPMAIGVWVSGSFTFVSDQLCDLLGYLDTELLQLSVRTLFPTQAEFRRVDKLISRELENRRVAKFETRMRRKDGTFVHLAIHTSLVDIKNVNSGCVSSVLDISALKRAQQARELLSCAVEQSEDIVMITDSAGSLVYVNTTFETITGYRSNEVIGQSPYFLRNDPQDGAFYDELWQTISSGKSWNGRFIDKKKSGEPFNVDVSIGPVLNGSDGVVHYVAVLKDITKKLELEAELLHAQKMESIERLAGGVAHDFNNLLTVILSSCSLLAEDMHGKDPRRYDVQQIEAASDRAVMLTRQLLAFSRRQPTRNRTVDLNQTVAGLRSMLRRLIDEHVEIVIALDAEPCWIDADPGQIEQIVMNLAVNASDAMPYGGTLTIVTANIELNENDARLKASCPPGAYVTLEVIDTGFGMDAETIAKAFDPFFTTKKIGRGTGLGLSTVYGLVKAHGGDIQLHSEKEKGTTVKTYFPRIDGTEAETMPHLNPTSTIGGSETVLVVEDDPAVRQLAKRILERKGYEVLLARDGHEGLSVSDAWDGPLHIVLTDLRMPKINGDEMAEKMLTQRTDLKVLFMSGYAENPLPLSAVLPRPIRFLQKPFSIGSLTESIRDALDSD